VWYSSVGCRVGQYNAAQLIGIQRISEGAQRMQRSLKKLCSEAQVRDSSVWCSAAYSSAVCR